MKTALAISIITVSLLLLAGPVHAAKLFKATTSVQTNLPTAGGQFAIVLQLTVPAGRWVIHAKTSAANFGTGDKVRCELVRGTTILDESGTNVGSASSLPFVAVLVNQAVTITRNTTNIIYRCTHDGTVAGIYLDPSSSLIIQEVVP